MATVFPTGVGRFGVQFKNNSGQRPTIRLGKCDRKYADDVARKVEHILACQLHKHAVNIDIAIWLNQLAPSLREKFAKAGLVDDIPPTTIADLCDYCMKHFGGKAGTQTNYRHAKDNLVSFFTAGKPIHAITKGDVAEYRKWSLTSAYQLKGRKGSGLSETTSSKRCKVAKQFFAHAVAKHWLRENPFDDMKGLVDSNDERRFFISQALIEEVLAHTEDPQLRLIVALVRYGGLRFPSEVSPLEPLWFNLQEDIFKVYAPKTERFRGKKFRDIPIFGRLKPFIVEAIDALPPNATRLIELVANPQAYTHRLHRTIIRAGFKPWAKTWHNMRSSLMTELDELGFTAKAITDWLGNSPSVAKKHYLQISKEQFRRAVEGDGHPAPESDAKSNATIGLNRTQPTSI